MATKKGQRIGILIIAIVMLVGTIASFAALILIPQNQASDQKRTEELTAKFQEEYQQYQAKLSEQDAKFVEKADEYSSKYYDEFVKYRDQARPFAMPDVTELKKKDLKEGDGEVLTSNDSFAVYYIGWTPDGNIFDGSIDGDKLKAPFVVRPGAVITGWTEGIDGMKVGGVRLLEIPSEMAYGEAGSGDRIPPHTPLKFIVMPIEKVEALQMPEVPEELLRGY